MARKYRTAAAVRPRARFLAEAKLFLRMARRLPPLNALRALAGLPALTDPGSDVARTSLLFRERAFWMWGTAHRLGDMRRLVRQYSRAQNTVFPTGEYHKGGEYGSDVNFPVSSDERNNPKFTGCIDRTA